MKNCTDYSKDRRLIIIENYGLSRETYLGCEISTELKPCNVSGHFQRKTWVYTTTAGKEVHLCEACHLKAWNYRTT